MRDLPPLNALMSFEATARLGGVRRAADELFVTPGAISRQIRLLEQHFNVKFFVRDGRGLILSEVGAAYYERIKVHFDGIRLAGESISASAGRSVINIRSYTTFATRWLISRLSTFQLAHPAMEVRLTMASQWGPLGDFDAAIRLGDGDWPGYDAFPLVPNVLVPVCNPSLMPAGRPMAAAEFRSHPLLFTRARPDDWELWLHAAGLDKSRFDLSREFESSALAYQAAIDGQGIAIAQRVLVEDDIAFGKLAIPSEVVCDRGRHTYYIVNHSGSAKKTELATLRRWLMSDGATLRRGLEDGRTGA